MPKSINIFVAAKVCKHLMTMYHIDISAGIILLSPYKLTNIKHALVLCPSGYIEFLTIEGIGPQIYTPSLEI